MSTYYFLICDDCREYFPLWGRFVGGSSLLWPANEDTSTVTSYIYRHSSCCDIKLISENDERIDLFTDVTDIPNWTDQ